MESLTLSRLESKSRIKPPAEFTKSDLLILNPLPSQVSSPGVLSVLTPLVISHLTGAALYTLPIHFQEMAVEHFPVSETEAVVLTAIAVYTAGLALPHNTNR